MRAKTIAAMIFSLMLFSGCCALKRLMHQGEGEKQHCGCGSCQEKKADHESCGEK